MTGSERRISFFLLVSLLLIGISVLAQEETCPEIVQEALDATQERCSITGRNEACYGNMSLDAMPREGVDDFTFSAPGDIVAVGDIEHLALSSRVEEASEWGIVLLQLQATLPDSMPGQNVTFVLFGDVEMTSTVEADEPMQAFYFNSGVGDAPCAEAPDSGILVQTPEGDAQIEFTVNDVDITLGSTVYLQAQPDGQMMTSVVEGEVTVTAGGESVIVPAGSQVHMLLDEQGRADGIPSQPQPYDLAKMEVLPIQLLPRPITIASPIGTVDDIIPTPGEWQAVWVPPSMSCDNFTGGNLTWDMSYYASFRLPEGE